ncbi:MAG: DUF1559 domain-containing protein [Planctomycetota bacterium]
MQKLAARERSKARRDLVCRHHAAKNARLAWAAHESVALADVASLARYYDVAKTAVELQQLVTTVSAPEELRHLECLRGRNAQRFLRAAEAEWIDLWNFSPRSELRGQCPAAVLIAQMARGSAYRPGVSDQFGSRFIFGPYTTLAHSTPRVASVRSVQRAPLGFTLVELLVAISIVAVLTALALPAMRGALERADRAVCLSNLRQLGQAFSEYVADHGHFPAAELAVRDEAGKVVARKRWYHAIAPYLGAPPAAWNSAQGRPGLVLPSADDRDQSVFPDVLRCPQADAWEVGRNCAYGYNHQLLGDARVVATNGAGEPLHRRFPVRRSEIWNPARTLLLTDSAGTGSEQPYRPPRRPSSRALGNHAFTVDPPLLPEIDREGHVTRWGSDSEIPGMGEPTLSSRPHGRHRGGCCVLFVDGHVKWLPLADVADSATYWGQESFATTTAPR